LSDNRIVAGDNRIDEDAMSAAAAESYRLLEKLTTAEHRGRGDTWGAAMGRAADKAGVPVSYAFRIWHRWREMKKADGDTLLALQAAYGRLCERIEASADAMDAETNDLRVRRHAAAVAAGRPEMDRRIQKARP
jgi:hypothetical protein